MYISTKIIFVINKKYIVTFLLLFPKKCNASSLYLKVYEYLLETTVKKKKKKISRLCGEGYSV